MMRHPIPTSQTLRILCCAWALQLVAASPILAEDYQLKLTQWWEGGYGGSVLNKAEAYQGVPLLRGQTALLPAGSRMELVGSAGEVFRLGGASSLTLLHDRQFRFWEGALLLYLPDSSHALRLQGPATEFWIQGEGTLAIQVTSNRGMKIVCLSHQPALKVAGNAKALQPGQVYFLPPGVPRIGRSLTIDLDRFVSTSGLLQGFKGRLPSGRQIRKNAFRQSTIIQRRTRMFVGDATSPEEFDLLLLED